MPNRSIPITLNRKFNVWVTNQNGYTGYQDYNSFLTQSATRRDLIEITLTNNHIKICMPEYDKCFNDTNLPTPINWQKAVVQFSHHSYNPYKSCENSGAPSSNCRPNTHHWDEFSLSPSIPFTIIKATERNHQVSSNEVVRLDFLQPAPPQSKLRFAALANTSSVQVSFDNQSTWEDATKQPHNGNEDGIFQSYFTGSSSNNGFVPEGVQTIYVKGSGTWVGNFIVVQDPTLWSQQTPDTSPSPTITPTPPLGIEGDINGDGVVNVLDFVLLSNAFGTNDPEADINNDGTVNVLDFVLLSNNFGS